MVKIAKSTGTPKVEIPDGSHVATCIATEEKYLEQDNFGNHDKVVLKMQFPDFHDDDGENAVVEAMVNKKFNEKSTLCLYAQALGIPVGELDELDTDDLVGKSALVLIETGESGWPRIKNMMALPKGYQAGAPAIPSVILASGEADWGVFWRVLKEKRGWAKAQVGDFLNLDMDDLGKKLGDMDGPDAQDLLEVLLNAGS